MNFAKEIKNCKYVCKLMGILQYFPQTLASLLPTSSFMGCINAPYVEGLETKSGKYYWYLSKSGPRPEQVPCEFVQINTGPFSFRISVKQMEELVGKYDSNEYVRRVVLKQSDEDIDNAMKMNICRCGTYPRLKKAVQTAAKEIRNG